MNLKDIKKELNDLEIEDLWSAIKGYFLGSMQCILENGDNPDAKIEFGSDLDSMIYELEEQVAELIDNYEVYCINWDNEDKEGDICL